MFAVFATHNKKAKLFGPSDLEKEMTAESLKKPFLSLSAPYSKTEKNDCCRKLPIFITVTLFVVICASVSISQIWNLNRINELQNDVDHLRNVVDEMRKHLGLFDLYDDLRNFKEDYDRRPDDSVTDKYDNSLGGHRKDSEIGSGNDDTYEDEDDNIREDDLSDPDYLEDDSFAYEDDPADDTSEDNDVPKDGGDEKRLKRSITGQTSQGVPILDESYASSRRNQTDDSINNLLRKNQNEDPKLKLYWHNKIEQQYRKNMQQGHMRHDKNDHRQKIIIREHEAIHHTYGAQNPMHTRRNRVMNTNEDKSKAFRQVISKSEYDNMGGGTHNYAEQRQAPEQVVYKQRSMGKSMGCKGNLKRSRPVAIHYIREQLPHRRGGNNMYGGSDSNRSFCDWVPAPWNKQLELHSNYFAMTNGVLTVRESGLYFIYAQIFYHDDHDTNGYIIEKNQEIFLQCTTMTHSVHRLSKSNSCYTGSLVLINSGDNIRLMDLGSERMTLGDSNKSFFGLVKLGDIKAPPTEPSTY